MVTSRALSALARALSRAMAWRPFVKRRSVAVRTRRLSKSDRRRLRQNLNGILRADAA